MEKRQRLILYGNTLMLNGMRLILEADPTLEVIPLDASNAAEQELSGEQELPSEQVLLALHPDVIIFDIGSTQPQFHFDLIQQRSGLQLVGIDPDSNQVMLWSGQHLCELSAQDLVRAIGKSFGENTPNHS